MTALQLPQLTDTKFLSAEEKKRVLVDWERFLRLGLRYQNFSKALYHHLVQHCEFIAHYDRGNFYLTYFEDPESTIQFLHQFDSDFGCGSVEYGKTTWWLEGDYKDVNVTMCSILDEFKASFYAALTAKARANDISTARALLAKHGIQL